MSPTQDLAPGTVLDGRFVVRRRLGAGGFGTVYLADQQVFGVTLRQVALKVFDRALVDEHNVRERLNDAVVLMRLQDESPPSGTSAHLVTVVDAGMSREDQPRAYVAMEHVTGYRHVSGRTVRTLADMIRTYRPVPVGLALEWFRQILVPLSWMHTLRPPVLHCDLKADNVLVDGAGALRLADFGLAQVAFGAIGARGGVGAVSCQSPEVLAGVEPTSASDVYSAGLLLHEILAGRHPLEEVGIAELAADDPAGYRARQAEARAAGIATLTEDDNPDLADHPLVVDLVARCLRFRATDRFTNAEILRQAVEAYEPGAASRPRPVSDDVTQRLDSARAAHRQGRREAAYQRCREAIDMFPGIADPYLCLAELYLADELPDQALSVCAEARRLPGLGAADDVVLHDRMAAAYTMSGQHSLAAVMRRRAEALRAGGRP